MTYFLLISKLKALIDKDLHVSQLFAFIVEMLKNKSGKLSQDTPVLPQVVKLGHAPDEIQV